MLRREDPIPEDPFAAMPPAPAPPVHVPDPAEGVLPVSTRAYTGPVHPARAIPPEDINVEVLDSSGRQIITGTPYGKNVARHLDLPEREKIVKLIAAGVGVQTACEEAAVSYRTFRNTLRDVKEFAEDVAFARARFRESVVDRVHLAGSSDDTVMNLETSKFLMGQWQKQDQAVEASRTARAAQKLEREKFEHAKAGPRDEGRLDITRFTPEQLDAYRNFLLSLKRGPGLPPPAPAGSGPGKS
jgi:hypothetical protein